MARPKGALNKRKESLLARIQREFPNYHPLMKMIKMAHDESNDLTDSERAKIHTDVCQYIEPKRKAVEHTGNAGVVVKIKDLSGK